MAYNPQVPPQEPEELLPYLNEEYLRVAQAFNAVDNGEWVIHHTIPAKRKPGMVKYFDGVNANPLGTGKEGLYRFGTDNLWHYIDDVPFIPPPPEVPTPWAAITPQNGWVVIGAYHYSRYDLVTSIAIDINAGTIASPIVIGSIPVGFRPSFDLSFNVMTKTLGSIVALPRLRVGTNGDLTLFNFPSGAVGIHGTLSVPLNP